MKTRTLFISIILLSIFILLILTACVSQQNKITGKSVSVTGVSVEVTTSPEHPVKEVEIRIDNDEFEPLTIEVNQNDEVKLVFLNKEPIFFSMDGYGINEKITTGVINFIADKKGEFSYYCLDCDGKPSGLMRVK